MPATNEKDTERWVCEFCGAELKPIEFEWRGKKAVVGHECCDCEQAQAHRQKEEKAKADCKEKEMREIYRAQYKKAKIPEKYWNAETNINEYLKVLTKRRGLYFYGEVGTGKTYAACALAEELIRRGCSVKFYDVPRIAREVKAARAKYDSEQRVLDRLVEVKFLILDDLGSEVLTDYNTEILRSVVCDREANNRPIIYTSNLSRGEFAENLAENNKEIMAHRLASRIKGSTEAFRFKGGDRRLS